MKNKEVLLSDGRTVSAIPMSKTGIANLYRCVHDLQGSYDLTFYDTYLPVQGLGSPDVYSLSMLCEDIDKETLCRFVETCTGVKPDAEQVWESKHHSFLAGAYFTQGGSSGKELGTSWFLASSLIDLFWKTCFKEALEQPTPEARLAYYYGQINKYLSVSTLRYLLMEGRAYVKYEGVWMLAFSRLLEKNWKFAHWLQPIIDRDAQKLIQQK